MSRRRAALVKPRPGNGSLAAKSASGKQRAALPRDGRETRREIIAAALRLFSRRGFEVSTREIAKAVGIASPSLYKHFRSIDEIRVEVLNAVAEERAREYSRVMALDCSPREMLKEMAISMISCFLEDATLINLYQQVLAPTGSESSDVAASLWQAGLYAQVLEIVAKVDSKANPVFVYFSLMAFGLGTAAFMPVQDRLEPLSPAERTPLVLAERALAAAMPAIDWTAVARVVES